MIWYTYPTIGRGLMTALIGHRNMADNADIDREFDRTTKILNTIYGRYITHILYSAIGSGAVVGVFASLSKEGGAGFYKPDVLFQSPVIIILIFAVPISL